MAGPRKFPDPSERSVKTPAVLCPVDRIFGLYNNETGEEPKRMSKTVREWFITQARSAGWSGVHFLLDVETGHTAGCLLWTGESTKTVTIGAGSIPLIDSDEGED